MLSILIEKIVGPYKKPHTWKIHKHRGIGKLPENPDRPANKNDPTLLHNLPGKLRAYGKSFRADEVVVVLVDLDDRPDCLAFKRELVNLLKFCPTPPTCLFRIAVEELEAWFLGDAAAIFSSYPHAKHFPLDSYIQDSQNGTWEILADVVHQGGFSALQSQGKRSCLVMEKKVEWAREITPHMDIEKNLSPSFQCFRDGLRRLVDPTTNLLYWHGECSINR